MCLVLRSCSGPGIRHVTDTLPAKRNDRKSSASSVDGIAGMRIGTNIDDCPGARYHRCPAGHAADRRDDVPESCAGPDYKSVLSAVLAGAARTKPLPIGERITWS